MTGLLAPRDLATARGWEIGTVRRYLTESRRRHRSGLHLRPMDIPLPDASDDPPRWQADGPIAAWIARTANPSTPRKDQP